MVAYIKLDEGHYQVKRNNLPFGELIQDYSAGVVSDNLIWNWFPKNGCLKAFGKMKEAKQYIEEIK